MINLMDNTKQELGAVIVNAGFEKYRAEQLFLAIQNGKDYDDNINLPQKMLNTLADHGYVLQPVKIHKVIKSKDKTVKFLFKLHDGNLIESVVMQYKYGKTICISTQVGCKMNCAFCASGFNFIRNLSAGEILGQVVAANKFLGGTLKDRQITNVVLMGSGEPLDNLDNVLKFLKLITNKESLNISVRNISLSTCGIPHKIEQLADAGFAITLCVSLHASNNQTRKMLMPIAKSYSIESVLESAKYYNTILSRRVIIEYVLIKGVNSNIKDAERLAVLLKDLQCHVNLIKLNTVKSKAFEPADDDVMQNFLNILCKNKISATIRRTLGDDIEGACGQLRIKFVGDKTPVSSGKKED